MSRRFENLTMPEFYERVQNAHQEMGTTLCKKRESYGPHNLTRFGNLGIVVRASDKVERLSTLVQSGSDRSPDGDSLRDAWMDLLGYATLGLIIHDLEREE